MKPKPVAKLMRSMIAGVLLLLAPVSVPAISDIGRSEITRIWRDTDNGKAFACSASYIFPHIDEYRSWIVSAGHCADATMAARNGATTVIGLINWRSVVETHGENGTTTADIALGTVPDVRDKRARLWLADKMPNRGEGYIHSFPQGVEVVTHGYLAPPTAAGKVTFMRKIATPFGYAEQRTTLAEAYPGVRFIIIPPGLRVGPGSSGSAVLDPHDRVIAILWGGIPNSQYNIEGLPAAFKDWDVVLVTPVEVLHEMFKNLGVTK